MSGRQEQDGSLCTGQRLRCFMEGRCLDSACPNFRPPAAAAALLASEGSGTTKEDRT